tara:strand:- start:13828 stop:15159 length:1332 start_codon:yes stop_codon:yes gene_type:complete
MKVTHLNGACEVIESNGVKILLDPWLVDGEYYGSWCAYPPLEDFDFSLLNDIDFIYISHIHPDHLSKLTLEKLNKDIPVLIHNFPEKFVKANIESLGFKVRELDSGKKTHLKNNVYIDIFSAGYCNPEFCCKSFGCGKMEFDYTSTTIDTLCVISDDDYHILNVNDCPYPVAQYAVDKVLKKYKNIDLLMMGYTGASAYPQCFDNYSMEEKIENGRRQKDYYFTSGLNFIKHVRPKHFMPMAGTYVLGGSLAAIEKYRAVNDIHETYLKYNTLSPSEGILLNTGESFDLPSQKQSKRYEPVDPVERDAYLKDTLRFKKYDFEDDEEPSIDDLKDLCSKSWLRFNKKREELNLSSDTHIYIYLNDKYAARFPFNGKAYEIVDISPAKAEKNISFRVNPKLLKRLLMGPRYAHWNNAEIGCHIIYYRNPDIYERGLHYCMNFFHA